MALIRREQSTRSADARPSRQYQPIAEAAQKPTPSNPRWRIPWGVVAMLGTILIVETFFARNWLDFSDPVSLSWRFSAMAAKRDFTGVSFVCLGDSLMKHALVPSIIEAETGRKSINLAAAKAPTVLTYFLLERVLAAGARPDAVIINVKPSVLMGGVDYNARYFEEILTPRELLELTEMTRRAGLMASVAAGQTLPSLRGRLEIRSNVMAAFQGQTDQLHEINRLLWRNWTVNEGANLANTDSGFTGEVTADAEKRLFPRKFHVDKANGEALDRLLNLAASRQIPVYWLLTPLAPELQAMRDQSGSEAAYDRLIRSCQDKHPGTLTVLDARRAAYPPACFVDATHLNIRGAIALSRAFSRVMGRELEEPGDRSSPRWLSITDAPDLDDPAIEVLENVEKSRKVIKTRASS